MVKKDISKEYCNFYFLIGYWENWFYSTLLSEKMIQTCNHTAVAILELPYFAFSNNLYKSYS